MSSKCIYYKEHEKSRCTNKYMCSHKYKDGMKNIQCDVNGMLESDKIKAKDKPVMSLGW